MIYKCIKEHYCLEVNMIVDINLYSYIKHEKVQIYSYNYKNYEWRLKPEDIYNHFINLRSEKIKQLL